MEVPPLTTERLLIRPLVMADLDAVHRVYDDIAATSPTGWPSWAEASSGDVTTRLDRQRWLHWTTLTYGELARLHQPPYGDRGIELRQTEELIGVCGFVPCLDVFGQVPALSAGSPGLASTEFGLYWAIAPAHQRRGYATEAGRAMIEYAFGELRLHRVIATTTYENAASIGVMRKLGMRIERNPFPDPPWLQVVGLLWHPSVGGARA